MVSYFMQYRAYFMKKTNGWHQETIIFSISRPTSQTFFATFLQKLILPSLFVIQAENCVYFAKYALDIKYCEFACCIKWLGYKMYLQLFPVDFYIPIICSNIQGGALYKFLCHSHKQSLSTTSNKDCQLLRQKLVKKSQ